MPLARIVEPKRPPGRIVTRIAAYDDPQGTMGHPDAHLEVMWSIHPHRNNADVTKTLTQTYDQLYGTGTYSKWAQYQLDSMFRGWNE